MPYVFALLLLLNIGALGYFLFLNEDHVDSPSVQHAKAQIENTVDITNPRQGK